MEHSKTPWRIEPATKKDNWRIIAANNQVVSTFSGNMDMDNARRIVACINAMAGIDNDNVLFRRSSIGTVRKHIITQQVQIEKLTAQRDELLAVLEAMLEEVAGCYCTTEAAARAVIQKVRGGE